MGYPDIIPDIMSGIEVVKVGSGQYTDIPHVLHQCDELAAPDTRADSRINARIAQVWSGLRIEARHRLTLVVVHSPAL